MQKTTTLKNFKVFLLKTFLAIFVLGMSLQVSFAEKDPGTRSRQKLKATSGLHSVKKSFKKTYDVSYTGNLMPGDCIMTQTFPQDGTPSACGTLDPAPTPTLTEDHYYDIYSFTNTTGSSQCVTVSVASSNPLEFVMSAAYSGTFNPNDIAANYLADLGISTSNTPGSYSFDLADGATVKVVVFAELGVPNTISAYNLNVTGLPQTCEVATTPTIMGTLLPICPGTSTVLFIDSCANSLNGDGTASEWVWYSSSCGGVEVGRGNSITINPSTTTDYFVRGEGACMGACSGGFTVTVNPAVNPSIIAIPGSTICEGDALGLQATSSVAIATYQWTPAGMVNDPTLQNVAATPPIGMTDFKVVMTDMNSCVDSATITITVNPRPEITGNPVPVVACEADNASFTAIATGNDGFQWEESINGGVDYFALSDGGVYSGTNTATLTITGATIGMSGNLYRAIALQGAGPCPASGTDNVSAAASLTVNPVPVATADPVSQAVCSGSNAAISLTSTVANTIFNWSRDIPTGTGGTMAVSGTTSNIGGPGSIMGTLTNTTNAPVTVTFTISSSANSCPGTDITATVVVNPIPDAVATPSSQTVCSALSLSDPDNVNIGLTSAVSNTTFTWTRTTATGLSGMPTSGSTTAAIEGVLMNTSGTAITVTFTIIPTANGCEGSEITATIMVQPLPTVNAVFNQEVCSGSLTTAVNFTGSTVTGTVYNWTNNNTDIGLAASGTGDIAAFTATNTTNMPISATITVTPVANGCSGTTTSFDILVNPKPEISIVADPPVICEGDDASVLTATSTVAGVTYVWSPAEGLSSPTGNPVGASPNVTSIYTAIATSGAGCLDTATVTVTVNVRPIVTSQPIDMEVCDGDGTVFGIDARGTDSTFQWQVSTDNGITFTDLADGGSYFGTQGDTLFINPVSTTMDGYLYRAVVSGVCAPLDAGTPNISNSALLTVNALPVVAITPTTTCGGVAGTSGTMLTASGADTYTWSPIAGLYTNATATTAYTGGNAAVVYAAPTANTTYTVTGTSAETGCSNTADATVNYTPAPPIVTPLPSSVCIGVPGSDISTLIGVSSMNLSTETFSSGTISVDIPEGTFPSSSYEGAASTISVSTIPADAVITGLSVTSNITHSHVGDVVMVLKAPNGNVFNLSALLNLTNEAGANFTNTTISSAGTAALNTGTAPYTGTFRPDGVGATFTAFGATLPGGPIDYIPNVTTFSGLYSVANGDWTLAMYDAGDPSVGTLTSWSINITYGFPDATTIWSPTTGLYTDAAGTVAYTGTASDTVYARPTTAGNHTYSVTVANGSCVSPARSVVVTARDSVRIVTQPVDAEICTDGVTTFGVSATGTGTGTGGALTYQWQVSNNGGTSFSNIANNAVYSGATTATLTVTHPPVTSNNFQYRVVINGASPCLSKTSTAAVLTVNPLPTVVISASPYTRLLPHLTTTLSATSTPAAATYTWFRDGVAVPGATSSSYIVNIDHLGDYTLRVTDVNGCTNTSNTVTIADSTSVKLFVYPNPNNGVFQVRYHSTAGNVLARTLTIYDAKGARVFAKTYTVGPPYSQMDVDVRQLGKGIYWIEVGDHNGKRLSYERVVIQ